MAKRPGPAAGALAASAALALAVTTLATARPGHLGVAVALAVALVWGTAGNLTDVLARRRTVDDADASVSTGTVTSIVRVRDEPDEVLAATVELARHLGPVVVLRTGEQAHQPSDQPAHPLSDQPSEDAGTPPGRHDTEPRDPGSPRTTIVAATLEEGVARAAERATTDAVLLTSARAFGVAADCRRAAGQVAAGADWVVGGSAAFNDDRFGADRRTRTDAALRRLAMRAGLVLWEPDATLVRTELLRDNPLRPGHSLGSWLRERAAEGHAGTVVDDTLSLRSAPVAAHGFWPDTVARQRGTAADLAAAAGRGSTRQRLLAATLLARTMFAWSLLVWVLAPVMLGSGFPLDVQPLLWSASLGAVVVLRWWALHRAVRVHPSPLADVTSAVYLAPGSLAATGAALTRRIHAPRLRLPSRPLVWVALSGTVVAGIGLLTRSPGSAGSRVAAIASVVLLAALWTLTVRALVERTWERTGFRAHLARRAVIEGGDHASHAGTVADGSAAALAFVAPVCPHAPGDEVAVVVDAEDGTPLELDGRVTARRRRHGEDLLVVTLDRDGAGYGDWLDELVAAALADPDPHPASTTEPAPQGWARVGAAVDRVVVGAVVVVSVGVALALVAVMLGYRPLVVRSGSMEPTYAVGDVVLVDLVPARDLAVGDVATLFDDTTTGQSLTHRVEAVDDLSADVRVTTRGDANDSAETWTVPADTVVGRSVAVIPWVGSPATLVRTSTPVTVVAIAVTVALVVVVVAGQRLARRPARPPAVHVPSA